MRERVSVAHELLDRQFEVAQPRLDVWLAEVLLAVAAGLPALPLRLAKLDHLGHRCDELPQITFALGTFCRKFDRTFDRNLQRLELKALEVLGRGAPEAIDIGTIGQEVQQLGALLQPSVFFYEDGER